MAVRFISKGKGKNRKSFPIKPKRGVSVRSVSLQPSSIAKVNKEQIKLLNRGTPATFSKALNQVVMRAKRDGIPIYDTHVNSNDRRKPYRMWIVKHPEKGDKIKGSDTIVMAEHYGQAIDDMITIWNKEERKNMTIGYPQVQGTAEKSFRFRRDDELEFHPFNIQISDPEGKNTTFVTVQATDEDTAIAKAKFSGQQKLNTKDVKIVKIERKERLENVISDAEAKEIRKGYFNKKGVSKEDDIKFTEWQKSKASDLYQIYVAKFPNSDIAQEYRRGALGHGHFGEALFEGRYADAMYRADSKNLVMLHNIGLEHFLSKVQRHPDDPSEYDTFIGRYNWAKDYKGE